MSRKKTTKKSVIEPELVISTTEDAHEPEEVEILPPEEVAEIPAADLPIDESPAIEPEVVDDNTSEKEPSTEVTRYDPLQAYLRDISQYQQLTREEEHALAIRYREKRDIDAAYRLVVSNLRLVVMIARDYQKAARSILDLIQEGNIGLMEAVKNFDPYRNVRFPSYAVWWIKAYIIRYLIANWRLVKIGTTQAQRKLFFNLQKERDKLEREGFYPAPKLLAEKLDVREKDIIEMEQRLAAPDVSVDAPLNDEEGESTLHSILPSGAQSAEELLANEEIQTLIKDSFDEFAVTLDKKELAIFQKRLLSDEKSTLHEIAEEFNLSRERIRQIENRIKEKLKAFLKNKFGAAVSGEDFGV